MTVTVFQKGHIPWNKGLTKETSKLVDKIAKSLEGKKVTEETIRKLSISQTKRFSNLEEREKIRRTNKRKGIQPPIGINKGRKQTNEQIEERRLKLFGQKRTEDEKQRIGIAVRKAMTSEVREKISNAKKGKPSNMLGKNHSERTKQKISLANTGKEGNIGIKNGMYKGENAGYSALHMWIRTILGNASLCEDCGNKEAKRYEWANISGEYKREVSDWKQLCRKCHIQFDRPRWGEASRYFRMKVNQMNSNTVIL